MNPKSDRDLARAVGTAVRKAAGEQLNQFVPKDEDRDGRSSAARLIKSAQQRPTSGIAASFSAAADNDMLKTDAERREERAHLAYAESAATGGRRTGNALRKRGERTAVEAIKGDFAKARVRDLLSQVVARLQATNLRKANAGSPSNVDRMPPQSSNGHWEDPPVRAKDGAQLARDNILDERARAGVREQATPFTGPNAVPHDQSVRDTGLPESQEDGTGNNHEPLDLVAIRRALRPENARPLAPGALGGRAKDPNRFDEE